MNKYLKFEYWNTCDLGNIYYQGGQTFIFFLDADVGEPFYEEVEDGQENGDGDFVPTFRRQIKKYTIKTGLLPEHLVDAMKRMELHDHVELTFKTGEVEQIYNVSIENEWQFEKRSDQTTAVIAFDIDEKVTTGACCDNLVVDDTEPIPELYWVSPTGSNVTGDGTNLLPWATWAYAASQAVSVGDVIHGAAGTYTETAQIVLAPGVSMIGAGATTIITTAAALNPLIMAKSVTDGTNGNQSISYLTLDGNITALSAMLAWARSNVKIHHITVIDFVNGGIGLRGAASGTNPTINATGNEIYSCTVSNSSTRSGTGLDGLIWMSGQEGTLIHDNVLTQNSRAAGQNGNIINAVGGGSAINSGFNVGIKYYNNLSYKTYSEGAAYNFHIESWDAQGWEIYDNEFSGGSCAIDMGGYVNDKGAYDYSFYVHDNYFYRTAAQVINNDQPNIGIDIESTTSDVIITRNHFKNLQWGIYHSLTESRAQNNIFIRYNIFESMGVTNNLWAGAVMIAGEGVAPAFTNLYYDNNVMTAGVAFNVGAGIYSVLAAGTATGVYVRNNIIYGFTNGPIWIYSGAGQMGTLTFQNNCLFNTDDTIHYSAGETITTLVSADNILADNPDFVGAADFHLQAGSPCINTGLYISLTTDYDGQPVANPPEIGAYEY